MQRRDFVKLGAGAIALGTLGRHVAANDRLQVGVIGCNGMGWANTTSLLKQDDFDVVAICDVDRSVIERRQADYARLRKNRPDSYGDYRELLARPDVDAVIIGTPDHWHCRQMIDAVRAGKHVYVEKPVANSIGECRLMVDAARESGLAVQTGQWQRSGPHYQRAREIVRSGVLGQIRLVRTWAYQGWMKPVPVKPDEPGPAGVDYDMWLGPAPKRPYNPNRFHFNFRWFWDYAGGLMTDWGVHEIDIALWVMGASAPETVMASGGKLAWPDDASETPDTLQAAYRYKDFSMLWEHATGIDLGPYRMPEGIAFVGNNGTLVVSRGGYDVYPEHEFVGWGKEGPPKMEAIESGYPAEGVNTLDLHTANFADAIRAGDPSRLNTPIESGALAAINAQMGNIAYRTGDQLAWNADSGAFDDNEAANQLIMADYHNGWTPD
ncbi:Gfo/Idh/MocA family oxidoreductase [Marinihelvus fidelis]|uniref:Gfo/Idh/MocA family oxidoreductase n=1 Tax=Marinihelvus fidelis TaxID=2613842 RepID=A0A5N0TJQ9_9GAMM|nr:Gfo/Idh/MocA family oxidoreductase [Marinihelvus fidelis]KAA9134156.1 Gfo/Idh/MocA family oxidoreductase [Marinihelvus fidelis]